jgi:hypothetical protein
MPQAGVIPAMPSSKDFGGSFGLSINSPNEFGGATLCIYGSTMISPFIPKLSGSAQM